MEAREQRGLQLAATKRVRRKGALWIVPSQRGEGSYVVDPSDGSCSCPDHEESGAKCKHVYAVEFTIRRETTTTSPNGTTTTVTETKTVKVRYPQNASAFNAAQVNEKAKFADLLRALCEGIAEPEQTRGRPRLPLRDVVFAATMKVYLTISGRRVSTDVRELAERGYMKRPPHYNSIFNYLERASLAPTLRWLIEQSATPFSALETRFAIDSTGFATSTYARWFDEKYGSGAKRGARQFVKCHLMSGVESHVVTSVEVTEGSAADAPFLPELVASTARRFQVHEVFADKAYLSRNNLECIHTHMAVPFIPFKVDSKGDGNDLWARLYHFFHLNRTEFLAHYHQRSNVETVFSMMKKKFGSAVRAKTEPAQRNEVFLKVLCHNLCVLVQSIYELGIDPVFWPAPPKVEGAAS